MKITDALIGAKLISVSDYEIKIEKDHKVYTLNIEQEQGGCCGYSEVETKLLINEKSKPVITKIEFDRNDNYENDTCLITFFGEYKPLATINSCSGSGSGYYYGACVTIECRDLDICEVITEW